MAEIDLQRLALPGLPVDRRLALDARVDPGSPRPGQLLALVP